MYTSLNAATSTLFPADWTFWMAGTKSLSPLMTMATSKWFIRACSSISHARDTSTSFCSTFPSRMTMDSLAMTLNPCSRRLLCMAMVSSSLLVNIFLASKTYAPTRSRVPTRIWVRR